MKAYRGTAFEALSTQHYAIYATTDIIVAEYYAGTKGRVYTLDLSALTIVDMDRLSELLADSEYADMASFDRSHNLSDYPLLGADGQCYTIADALNIDGVIDDYGNIEIYNGLDIVVID